MRLVVLYSYLSFFLSAIEQYTVFIITITFDM